MKPHADQTADDAWRDDHLRLELKRLQKELDDCRRQLACRDITDAQEAQEEARAHLWFLENMDRVNRAIQATNDLSAWAFPSVAPPLRIMEAASGPLQPTGREQLSVLSSVRLPRPLWRSGLSTENT
jgi:hypothetical protein